MYDFIYHRATSIGDAQSIFKNSEDPVYLAGGMTVLPTMKQRLANPSDVIDLGKIDGLTGVERDGDEIVVRAMTTHAAVAASSEVAAAIPALAALADSVGDPHVRNRGTIGGSIANNDPAADYPAALVGLGGTVVTTSKEVAADDFFTGMFETVLEPGELITAVRFPVSEAAHYMKFPNPASRYALVGVMVARTGGVVRVAVTGAGPCVFRIGEMEAALAANFRPEVIENIVVAADGLNSDIHAGSDYRAHLVGVMASRAVAACG